MSKLAVLKSARSSGPLRRAGCAVAAAGLVAAGVPAAQAAVPATYTVTLSCSSYVPGGQTQGETQCYGYLYGGNGTYYATWTVSGYTKIFEENYWALSFYCTPGTAYAVTVAIHDSTGQGNRASSNGTCA